MLVWLSVWSEVQIVCKLGPMHPKTLSSLASSKSQLVLPFWYWLAQVVLEKRPVFDVVSSGLLVSAICKGRSNFWNFKSKKLFHGLLLQTLIWFALVICVTGDVDDAWLMLSSSRCSYDQYAVNGLRAGNSLPHRSDDDDDDDEDVSMPVKGHAETPDHSDSPVLRPLPSRSFSDNCFSVFCRILVSVVITISTSDSCALEWLQDLWSTVVVWLLT